MSRGAHINFIWNAILHVLDHTNRNSSSLGLEYETPKSTAVSHIRMISYQSKLTLKSLEIDLEERSQWHDAFTSLNVPAKKLFFLLRKWKYKFLHFRCKQGRKTSMTDDVMVLDIWSGSWDLPSIDHDCLTVLVR